MAGGLLVVGGSCSAPNELLDEASGRWFALPHPMAEPRGTVSAEPLPVAAMERKAILPVR